MTPTTVNIPEHVAIDSFSPSDSRTAQNTDLSEGWGWVARGRRWHLFVDGRSACGKYVYVGTLGPLRERPLLWWQKKTSPCRACWQSSPLAKEHAS